MKKKKKTKEENGTNIVRSYNQLALMLQWFE